jgi:hypothetical protein
MQFVSCYALQFKLETTLVDLVAVSVRSVLENLDYPKRAGRREMLDLMVPGWSRKNLGDVDRAAWLSPRLG